MDKIKTILVYLLVIAAVVAMIVLIGGTPGSPEKLDYAPMLKLVKEEKIAKIEFRDNVVKAWKPLEEGTKAYSDSPDYTATAPSYEEFTDDVKAIVAEKINKDVDLVSTEDFPFEYVYTKVEPSILLELLPTLLLVATCVFLVVFLMKAQGNSNSAMNFGKTNARVQLGSSNNINFASVEGADEEKEELSEVVEFLKNPKRFSDMGARIPKGVLLVGPPGTGKTLLAKAAAGEANCPFFSISGSDFVEMFVGVGASRVRDLFNTAKKSAPAIVFIDEIDAVGRQRGTGLGGGHDEREQTLNQILVEMDGFVANQGIIVMAATNRPDILDPALVRPGRFDRRITVNYPDMKGREAILNLYAKNKPLAEDVNLNTIARRTPGFTGADLENLLNEAAILTARKSLPKITTDIIEESITRVMMGPEKRSRVIKPVDKLNTAYHEAGHAVVALKLEHCDSLHEVSIIPRGDAAGYTMTLPEEDIMTYSRNKLYDEICMMLGGRAAEMYSLDDISTGASNDIQRATGFARRMVSEFGMSDKIGPMFLAGGEEIFIGRDFGHTRDYSDELASEADGEVRRILNEQLARATQIISSQKEAFERVVAKLVEVERLTGEEFAAIFNGEAAVEA